MNLHTNIFWSWLVVGGDGGGKWRAAAFAGRKKTPKRPAVDRSGHSTVFMVVMLVSVVGGVFIVFALMALCYRSVVVHRNLSLCLRLVESFHYVARRDGPKKVQTKKQEKIQIKFQTKSNQKQLLLCLDARFYFLERPCSYLFTYRVKITTIHQFDIKLYTEITISQSLCF